MLRRLTSSLTFLALLAAAPAALAGVNADYDRAADFSKLKTFAFKRGTPASSELAERRIHEIVTAQLRAEGMTPVERDPDAWIVTHAAKDERMSVRVDEFGYRYGRRYHRWGGGYGSYDVRVDEYTVGTLIVDVVDASSGNMVWRGTATATVVQNPDKMYRRVEKVVRKLFDKYYPPNN
jgi:hypothetical protein